MSELNAYEKAIKLWQDYQAGRITAKEMIEQLEGFSAEDLEKPLEIFDAKILGELGE